MTNAKRIVNDLISDNSEMFTGIEYCCGYPNEIKNFPCIIFVENGQRDLEFNDNLPQVNEVEIEFHIFTKKLSGYLTSNEIASKLDLVFRKDFWAMVNDTEVGDPDNEVEHRTLNYRKEFLF